MSRTSAKIYPEASPPDSWSWEICEPKYERDRITPRKIREQERDRPRELLTSKGTDWDSDTESSRAVRVPTSKRFEPLIPTRYEGIPQFLVGLDLVTAN